MTEAASQLDLQILVDDDNSDRLIPSIKKRQMYRRMNTQILLLLVVIGFTATLVRWLRHDFQGGEVWNFYPPLLCILLIVVVLRREQIKGIYILNDDQLVIPYTWFYRRSIPLKQIIRVDDDTITDQSTGQKFAAIRIIVDCSLVKLNITGMQSSNILLSTQDYDSMDLNRFADEISKKVRSNPSTPNTLAQRLSDQVNRSWSYRWSLILFNSLDSTTEATIYLFIADAIFYGFFGVSIWPLLGGIILGIYLVVVILIQFLNKPQAIIGIRPHELGPLIYDEEELITSVRFILICHPYTVHLQDCEVVYPDGASKQVGRLQQIQPEYAEPGELIYGIAQIVGNHTKATGAVIRFTYKETEAKKDVLYEIPITWA